MRNIVEGEAMSLKQSHYESCKAEGLTDEEIEQDWREFEDGYIDYLREREKEEED